MNVNKSNFDPRVPSIIPPIVYDILAGLDLSKTNIKFSQPNQLLGSGTTTNSDGSYTVLQSQLNNNQIPDQQIATIKILGLDNTITSINTNIQNILNQLNGLTLTDTSYTTYDITDVNNSSPHTTVINTLQEIASALSTLYDLYKFGNQAYQYLTGLRNAIGTNNRAYTQLIDEVDDVVENAATNAENIATQTSSNVAQDGEIAALQTRATAIETKDTAQDGQITALQGRATAIETKDTAQDGQITALQGRATAIETVNTTQDGQIAALQGRATALEGRATAIEGINTTQTANIAALTTDLAANDAHDIVQDGLISANTAAATANAAALTAAVGTLEGEIAAVGAAAALGAALAGIFGLTGTKNNDGTTTYNVTNPAFDPTNINNAISALQTDNTANKTFLSAMVANGYITFANNTYTLSTGFKNAVTNIATNSSSILDIYTKLLNAGFLTSTTTNGVTTYSPTAAFTNLLTNVATNTTNIATNTSNIATNTSNIATNTSNIAMNTTNISQLRNAENSLASLINQVGIGVPTYDANSNVQSYVVPNIAKNLALNHYYGMGISLNGYDYLPPYQQQIFVYWQVRNLGTLQTNGYLQSNSSGTSGNNLQNTSYIANIYPIKGIATGGATLTTGATGNNLPYAVIGDYSNASGSSIGSPQAYEAFCGSGGFLVTGLKLNDYAMGVSGSYTVWVIFRSYFNNIQMGSNTYYIMGSDSGSNGVCLAVNQYGLYTGCGYSVLYGVQSPGTNTGTNNNTVQINTQRYYYCSITYSVNDANSTQYYNYGGPSAGVVTPTVGGTKPIGSAFKVTMTINGKQCGTSACDVPSINSPVFGIGCRANTSNNFTTNNAPVGIVAVGVHQADLSSGAALSNMYSWVKLNHPAIPFNDPY